MVWVGPSAGGRVDVTHHTVTRRHDGAQGLRKLLLLLPVLGSAVLEPHLKTLTEIGLSSKFLNQPFLFTENL